MTETALTSTTDNTTRGIPYYEKLKRDLRETLHKKQALDKSIATLEDQIYRIEASYLEETSAAGNIIKGFDNYIKGSALSGSVSAGAGAGGVGGGGAGGGGGGTSTRRKGVTEQDRVFSRSSCSYMRVCSSLTNGSRGSREGKLTDWIDRSFPRLQVSSPHLTRRRQHPEIRSNLRRERVIIRRRRARRV